MATFRSGKYLNLPDVDYEQPDVYETEDVHVPPQEPDAEVGRVPGLDLDSIDIKQAKQFFNIADSKSQDKQDLALLYRAALFKSYMLDRIGSEYSVVSSGPSSNNSATREGLAQPETSRNINPFLAETSTEKLRRLIFEVQELQEQVDKDDSDLKSNDKGVFFSAILDLSSKLRQIDNRKITNANPAIGNVSSDLWERYQIQSKPNPNPKSSNDTGNNHQTANATDGNYPATVSEFERRISKLEKLVGLPLDDNTLNMPQAPLTDTIDELNKKIQLLSNPSFLDAVSKKSKLVLMELNNLSAQHKKLVEQEQDQELELGSEQPSSNSLDTENNKRGLSLATDTNATRGSNSEKINALYQKLPELNPIISLLPSLVSRLDSLSQTHLLAKQAVDNFSFASENIAKNSDRLHHLNKVTETLKASIDENSAMMIENIKTIEAKIVNITNKLK